MDTIKVGRLYLLHFIAFTYKTQSAANYVSESIQGTGAEASKEANKQVAKDNEAKLTTRATAAKDALVDKKDEHSHDVKADVYKGKIACDNSKLWKANFSQSRLSTKRNMKCPKGNFLIPICLPL